MTDKEIATLEKKVTRAKNLQQYIEDTEKRIEAIQSEISYNPDGTELNVRRYLTPELPYKKIIPIISFLSESRSIYLAELERTSSVEITDNEIISLGNFIISILQKRVKRWKAELKKL